MNPDYDKARRQQNRRAKYERRKEYYKAKMREYYKRNKARCNAVNKQWAINNHEAVVAYRKRHYLANKERIDAANRAYRKAHPELRKHQERVYYLQTKARRKLDPRIKLRAHQNSVELTDGHVRQAFRCHSRIILAKNIPIEMVELKRAYMKLNRELKRLCQSQQL